MTETAEAPSATTGESNAEAPPATTAESNVEEGEAEADVIQIVDDAVPTPTPEMVSHKQGGGNRIRIV